MKDDDTEPAIALAERAVALEPTNADFHFRLANVYTSLGRQAEAIRAYREAIRLKPNVADWHVRLATTLTEAGHLHEALDVYRARVAAGAPDARAYFDLGEALQNLGYLEQAEQALQQAAMMAPEAAGIYFHLAMVRQDQGRPVDAEESARRAIAAAPDMPQGWFALGSVLTRQGRHLEAVEHYRKALAMMPDYDAAWAGLLFSMNYSEHWSPREVYDAHVEWGKRFPKLGPAPIAFSRRTASHRIRVGYVSPDYRQHAVSHFIEPLLRCHDRARFEVFCYHTLHSTRREDSVTTRLKGWAEHWRPAPNVSDDELERVLRDDDLDILVELCGHTEGHRLSVLARRIAPVQVTYLGYPNTTGVTAIDYRITDANADPPGESDKLHVEKLVRLPKTFLCYSPPDVGASSRIPPFHRNAHITFGSFNSFPKISRTSVRLWASVLSSVPNSKLFIKTNGLQDPGLRTLLVERLSKAGVGIDRVSIAGPIRSHREHMETYGQVDIALDTFPYHGTTTTLDALWMGVPVITLAGDRHASRVGVSILSTLGLTELVAQTGDEYVAAAVELSRDADRLDRLSRSLRERLKNSPLTDGLGFTAGLEAAYLEMWRRLGAR